MIEDYGIFNINYDDPGEIPDFTWGLYGEDVLNGIF
jgi:hypothetical protein